MRVFINHTSVVFLFLSLLRLFRLPGPLSWEDGACSQSEEPCWDLLWSSCAKCFTGSKVNAASLRAVRSCAKLASLLFGDAFLFILFLLIQVASGCHLSEHAASFPAMIKLMFTKGWEAAVFTWSWLNPCAAYLYIKPATVGDLEASADAAMWIFWTHSMKETCITLLFRHELPVEVSLPV